MPLDTANRAMRILVYEYMTASGVGRAPGSPEHGMYLEGRAMRDAIAEDFRRVPGVEVFAPPDDISSAPEEVLIEFSALEPEWTVLIAPETDDTLLTLAGERVHDGAPCLGPSPSAIRLTSDKLALANHWRAHGVPTPATTDRGPTPCEAFPVVWKPRDGAGSADTFLIRDRFELAKALASQDPARPMILQEFVPGRAASVAFLCGPPGAAVKPGSAGDRPRVPAGAAVKPGSAGDRPRVPAECVPLLPAFQLLSDDGRFKYEGGELPTPPALAGRALELAGRAVECVPGLLGYVGVDLILGDAGDGSRDFAIEINPRLTTSYIGLRALADFNIAELMLKVARGEGVGELKWRPGRVRFTPDGRVAVLQEPGGNV